MPREESLIPLHWLRYAERDLARVEMLLDARDPELAGVCLQQAVEKYLKAYLLSQGWRLRRIHDLEALLDDALEFNADFEPFNDCCHQISAFYYVERYPFLSGAGVTEDEVRDSLKAVMGLIDKLRALVSTG